MPPPERAKLPTEIDDLQWMVTDDGSLTLWDMTLNETYHSGCGAAAESLVVYLSNSGVLGRLASGLPTRVFEMGFGTGSAFLLTAAVAEHFHTQLDFWAIEIRPLPSYILAQAICIEHLNQALADNVISLPAKPQREPSQNSSEVDFLKMEHFCQLGRLADQLAQSWPADLLDRKQLNISLGNYCKLNLIIGDATELHVDRDCPELSSQVDAVYFDAFSPETNPQLWSSQVLREMHQMLVPGGCMTSYCVKSAVRRTMEEIGFSVSRMHGPVGGKREVLFSRRS